MRYLKTSEAATLLNVSPNTLRAWERRFGYPKPQRSPGKHRLYTHGEIAALRDALHEGLSISSAISRAREGLSADADTLIGALVAFDRDRADHAMEAALALRSLERTVEEVMLPSLDELMSRQGAESAPWAFATRWAGDWLTRARRFTPPPVRHVTLLIGDATAGELDPDTAALRAFELFCARAGAKLLCLSIQGVNGMAEAFAGSTPDAVVLAGGHAPDEQVARWAYAVRSAAGPLPVTLYRRDVLRPLRARSAGARALSAVPSKAQLDVLEIVEADRMGAATVAQPTRLVPREQRAGA